MVIKAVAEQLKSNQRGTDIAGRYGGEEFVIILDNIAEKSGRIFAERLRLAVQKMVVQYGKSALQVTISLGLAEISGDYKNAEEWLGKAEMALYRAKATGRNRSVLSSNLQV